MLVTGKTISSMDHQGSGVTLRSGVFRYCDLRCHRWQLSPTSKLSSSRNNLVPDLQPLQFTAWHISLNHLHRLVNASVSRTYPPACELRQLKLWSPFMLAAPAKEPLVQEWTDSFWWQKPNMPPLGLPRCSHHYHTILRMQSAHSHMCCSQSVWYCPRRNSPHSPRATNKFSFGTESITNIILNHELTLLGPFQ